MQYRRTLKNNIYHSNNRVPPPFFHTDNNPVLGHVLIHSFDKTHVLVVALEYTLSTLFQSRTYFCQVYKIQKKLCKALCCHSNQPHKLHSVFAWCALHCSKLPRSFFCSCLSPMIVYLYNLFLLATPLARMLLTPGWSQAFHQPQNNVIS